MVSITDALRRIKGDWANVLSAAMIERACRDVGHEWRERVLDPVSLIHLFILQVLHDNAACSALPRISRRSFTASAYCQARAKLPLKVITTLVARVNLVLQEATRVSLGEPPNSKGLWRGHRVIVADGSNFSMPDTPALQKRFGQPGAQKKGCGFPVAHLLASFDAYTGLIQEAIAAPLRTHDMALIQRIHAWLRPNDLLLADRGFCSFAHLALLLRGGRHACFRMHQKQIVRFQPRRRSACGRGKRNQKGLPRSRWIKSLGRWDQIVEWSKPAQKPCWMSDTDFDALPAFIRVREMRYRVSARGVRTKEITLVTTLLDAEKYPAEDMADLYQRRWQVETNFRHLKTTMKMEVLRCQSVDGVLKEMAMFVLVYNLVRMVMLEAARRQGVEPDRISFIDALRWLAHAPPDRPLPALVVNPDRPNRIEPRVVKRRAKPHDLLNKPRAVLRAALMKQRQVA